MEYFQLSEVIQTIIFINLEQRSWKNLNFNECLYHYNKVWKVKICFLINYPLFKSTFQ